MGSVAAGSSLGMAWCLPNHLQAVRGRQHAWARTSAGLKAWHGMAGGQRRPLPRLPVTLPCPMLLGDCPGVVTSSQPSQPPSSQTLFPYPHHPIPQCGVGWGGGLGLTPAWLATSLQVTLPSDRHVCYSQCQGAPRTTLPTTRHLTKAPETGQWGWVVRHGLPDSSFRETIPKAGRHGVTGRWGRHLPPPRPGPGGGLGQATMWLGADPGEPSIPF